MERDNLYHDYNLIFQMKCSIQRKIRLLSELFADAPEPWRVTGITKEALEIFKKHNFKRVSKMGINRSHKVDRYKTYKTMLENKFIDVNEWWNLYLTNDQTILATSNENLSSKFSKIIEINPSDGLFKNSGFGWKHGKKEEAFLREMYSNVN